jgi:SAM-dependent methyltransferase
MRLYRRALHAIDNHTLKGAIRRLFPHPQDPPFREFAEAHPFDRRHATDTSGHIPGETLTPANRFNTAYYAISPSTLGQALELLPEPAFNFTFVDLGCGKGRALLVAAELPFQRIVGIELSTDLCQIARENTRTNRRIDIQQHDAATVAYPDGPLLIFLYHPFLKPVVRRVLANLDHQRARRPDSTYLLYANCTYQALFAPAFQLVWDHSLPLSPEDAAADRHHITHERFTLYRLTT